MQIVEKLSDRATKVNNGKVPDKWKLKKAAKANFESMALRCKRTVPVSASVPASVPSSEVATIPMPEILGDDKKANTLYRICVPCYGQILGNTG